MPPYLGCSADGTVGVEVGVGVDVGVGFGVGVEVGVAPGPQLTSKARMRENANNADKLLILTPLGVLTRPTNTSIFTALTIAWAFLFVNTISR